MTPERAFYFAGLIAGDARKLWKLGDRELAREYVRAARSMHDSEGIEYAYSRSTRAIRRLLGMELTERVIAMCRTAGQAI